MSVKQNGGRSACIALIVLCTFLFEVCHTQQSMEPHARALIYELLGVAANIYQPHADLGVDVEAA